MAAANDAAVRRLRHGLRLGDLVEGLEPVAVDTVVALGQSMGGCLSIVMQAKHQTCDGCRRLVAAEFEQVMRPGITV